MFQHNVILMVNKAKEVEQSDDKMLVNIKVSVLRFYFLFVKLYLVCQRGLTS